jgi:4-amino-4-deoxy-L-arabinose transferase-like glycosyltransferase
MNKDQTSHILFGISLLAYGLYAFINLNTIPVGHDEPFSIFVSQFGISDIIVSLKGGNNPPLYELLLHFWTKAFGIGPRGVRSLSLIFSLGTILIVYIIIRQQTNPLIAFLSALLVATSSSYFFISHEARCYALLTFLVSLTILQMQHAAFKSFGIAQAVYLGFLFCLIAYTHYIGIFWVLFCIAYLLLSQPKNLKYILLSTIILVVGYLPYLSEFLSRLTFSHVKNSWLPPVENLGNFHDFIYWFSNHSKYYYLVSLTIIYSSLVAEFAGRYQKKRIRLFISVCLVILFFAIGASIYYPLPLVWRFTELSVVTHFFLGTIFIFSLIELSKSIKHKSSKLKSIWFLVLLVALFYISQFIPVFSERYLLFLFIPMVVFLADSIWILFKSWKSIGITAIILLVLISLATFKPTYHNHLDMEQIVSTISKEKGKTNLPVVLYPYFYEHTFMYFYDIQSFQTQHQFTAYRKEKKVFGLYNSIEHISDLKEFLLLDINSDFSYPTDNLKPYLFERYKIKSVYSLDEGVTLYNLELKSFSKL